MSVGWGLSSSGNMTSIAASPPMTDPVGETSHYAYDLVGRMVSLVYPGGFASTRTYNAQNQLERGDTGERVALNYAYDPTGPRRGHRQLWHGPAAESRSGLMPSPTTGSTGSSAPASEGRGVERRYDSRGRLLAESAGGATIACRYDDAGRHRREALAGRPHRAAVAQSQRTPDRGRADRSRSARRGATGRWPHSSRAAPARSARPPSAAVRRCGTASTNASA